MLWVQGKGIFWTLKVHVKCGLSAGHANMGYAFSLHIEAHKTMVNCGCAFY